MMMLSYPDLTNDYITISSSFLNITSKMSNNININSCRLYNLGDPVNASDAISKSWYQSNNFKYGGNAADLNVGGYTIFNRPVNYYYL